jgi:RNA polymerase sigma-70 factor (ECF subfamily)
MPVVSAPPPGLLPRIAKGDRSAIRDCIARYGALVWSLARRAAQTDAEDAVQEIFLELRKSAARFDPRVSTEVVFVATVARRRLVDRRRQRQRRPETESFGNAGESNAIAYDSVAPEMGAEAALAARALETLRPEQRQVLILTTCHGLSHEEVATSMSMPLGTVKAHARRGLIRLREALGEMPIPGTPSTGLEAVR